MSPQAAYPCAGAFTQGELEFGIQSVEIRVAIDAATPRPFAPQQCVGGNAGAAIGESMLESCGNLACTVVAVQLPHQAVWHVDLGKLGAQPQLVVRIRAAPPFNTGGVVIERSATGAASAAAGQFEMGLVIAGNPVEADAAAIRIGVAAVGIETMLAINAGSEGVAVVQLVGKACTGTQAGEIFAGTFARHVASRTGLEIGAGAGSFTLHQLFSGIRIGVGLPLQVGRQVVQIQHFFQFDECTCVLAQYQIRAPQAKVGFKQVGLCFKQASKQVAGAFGITGLQRGLRRLQFFRRVCGRAYVLRLRACCYQQGQ